MAVINYEERVNRSMGQGFILIWKGLGENDARRYEMFKRATVIYEKYKDGELGISLGSLNNYFSKQKTTEPIIFENDRVRIVRTKLFDKKDFPSEETIKESK